MMNKKATAGEVLGHILVPMVTPFTKDCAQDVDYKKAAELADYLIQTKKCDSIAVAGTTGEFNVLSHDERVELFRVVHDAVAGRVPLVAGTGAASTREAVCFTKTAQEIGYDYALIVAPYYCKPCASGIYHHYKAISDATEIPILLYNIPIFTGINIPPQTVGELSKLHNVVGIKDEAGLNPTQMTEYIRAVGRDDFTVYNGDDIMVLCGLAQGAAGVVSGGAHLIGGHMRRMINAFLAGDLAEAQKIHHQLDPLFKAFCPNGRVNPIPLLRAAMQQIGLDVGDARAPLYPAQPDEIEQIVGIMRGLEIL